MKLSTVGFSVQCQAPTISAAANKTACRRLRSTIIQEKLLCSECPQSINVCVHGGIVYTVCRKNRKKNRVHGLYSIRVIKTIELCTRQHFTCMYVVYPVPTEAPRRYYSILRSSCDFSGITKILPDRIAVITTMYFATGTRTWYLVLEITT